MMNREKDESLLIDFVLGQCEEDAAKEVKRRLEEDKEFSALHQGIARTFQVMGRYEPPTPSENLVERTMARVRAMRQTEALVAAPSIRRRAWTPTFTLRELTALAAMAVVAVGILIPTVSHARRQSQRELCMANQLQIGTALNSYAIDNNDAFPAAVGPTPNWMAKSGQAASNSSALFQLVAKTFASPDAFQCPAVGGKSFAVQAGMIDFPHPQSISYSYQYSVNTAVHKSDRAVAGVAHDFAILADATPVFHDGSFDPVCAQGGQSRNHADGGQNVLYLDNTVRWATNCRAGVNGDNIWIVDGVYDYKGDEKPASPTDSFLLPNPGQ